MKEVNQLAVDVSRELWELVDALLFRPPVKVRSPIIRHPPQVVDWNTSLPGRAGKLFGPPVLRSRVLKSVMASSLMLTVKGVIACSGIC
jgi:hypothetical protein